MTALLTDAVIVAAVSGPLAILIDRGIGWARTRRHADAEAGLTVDQRWERYADTLEERLNGLETRLKGVEADRRTERDRSRALTAEVDYYRSVARSLLKHVMRLREELGKAGGTVPTLPADIADAVAVSEIS